MGSEAAGGPPGEVGAGAGGAPGTQAGGEGRTRGGESPPTKDGVGGEGAKTAGPGEPVRLPWLRVQDQVVVAVLVGMVLVSLAVYYGRASGWGRREVELERLPEHELDWRLDPNQANWVEWMQLPGIGKTLADRIVKDREERGAFRSVDDLLRVRGIGKVNLERIRPYLRWNTDDADGTDRHGTGSWSMEHG